MLSGAEPSLAFGPGPSDGPTSVSVAVGDDGFAAAVRSESGTCWWVRIDPTGVHRERRDGRLAPHLVAGGPLSPTADPADTARDG